MNTTELTYRGKEYVCNYPGSWETITDAFLYPYAQAIASGLKGEALLIEILRGWLNVPRKVFDAIKRGHAIELYSTIEFLFTEKIKFTDLIIKKIKLPFRSLILKTYYGPGREWRNVTTGEWAFADAYCGKYLADKDAESLDMVIAALYRPTNLFRVISYVFAAGDIRAKFNPRTAERRAKKFKKLPEHVKLAILYNFLGYRNVVVDDNDFLFNGKSDTDGPNFQWMGIMKNLAGPELGTLDEMESMLFKNALLILKMLDAERKEAERKAPKKEN